MYSNTPNQDFILFFFLPYMTLELGFSALHQDNEQTIQMSLYVPEEDENKLTDKNKCYR